MVFRIATSLASALAVTSKLREWISLKPMHR